MKRIFRLIQCEFIKDFSWIKVALCGVILFLVSWAFLSFWDGSFSSYYKTPKEFYQENVDYIVSQRDKAIQKNADDPSFYHQLVEDTYRYVTPYYEDALDNPLNNIDSYLQSLTRIHNTELVLEALIENFDTDFLRQVLEDNDSDFLKSMSYDYLIKYSTYSLEELESELAFQQQQATYLEEAITTGEYYHAIEYFVYSSTRSLEDITDPCYQYIIDNKIADENDVRIENQCFYYELEAKEEALVLPTLEEFMDAEPYQFYGLQTYAQVERYYALQNDKVDRYKQITEYAIDHNVPHGIMETGSDYYHMHPTSQTYMSYGLYLSFAIVILLTICHAGILSNEHKNGTVKLLYTRKSSRLEVITAKFIYVVINMYMLLVLASIIYFCLVGSRYGFASLLGSKIITLFGNTMSVPYLLWYFVSMLICSIPLFFYIAILFLCSAFIPTTAVTSTLLTVITIFFSIIWILIYMLWRVDIGALVYLPFSYIEYAFSYLQSFFYLFSAAKSGVPTGSYGIWITLICTVIVFIVMITFYRKKDIKN